MVHCQMLKKIQKRYSFYFKRVNPVLFIKTSRTVDVMISTSILCMFIWLQLFFLTNWVFFQKSLHTTEEFCDKGVPPIWNTASDESYRLSNKITCRSRVYQFNWPTSLVWIPEFTYFPTDLHNITTDVERNLKLSDISGLLVGHAPRSLSFAFLQLIEKNCQIHALTIVTCYGKGRERAVIPCDYVITCSQDNIIIMPKK